MPTNESAGSFNRHVVRGSVWMVAMRWSMRLIGLVSTIILARLLLPNDFGIIAMALIVTQLLEILASTGVDLALIRDQDASREHYDTAWTIQLVQGTAVTCLLLLVAPLAGHYFEEPAVTAVIRVMALKALLEGCQNIGVVAFRKELDFAKEFRFNLYKKLINFAIVVAAALLFRNYWALVVGMLSASAIGVGLSYLMHPYRPRLSLGKVREIWSFSQWLLLSRIGFFLNRKADQFVVGGIIGTAAMGSYHVSRNIASMPTEELVMPLRRALFPNLSKVLDETEAFQRGVLQTFATVAAVSLPLGFGLMAIADLAVPLLLGDNWSSAIPLMRWLALVGAFAGLTLVLEVPLWVRGKTHWSALQTWSELLVSIPLLVFATHAYGLEGAAATRAAVAAAFVPVMMYLGARACGFAMSQLAAAVLRPLIAGSAMAAVVFWFPVAAVPLLAMAVKIVLGSLVYVSVLLGLWLLAGRPHGVEAIVVRQIGSRLAKPAGGAP